MVKNDDSVRSSYALRRDVDARFSSFVRDNGLIKADLMSRLVTWFVDQDRTVQSIFTHRIHDEDAAAIARIALTRIIASADQTQRKAAKTQRKSVHAFEQPPGSGATHQGE